MRKRKAVSPCAGKSVKSSRSRAPVFYTAGCLRNHVLTSLCFPSDVGHGTWDVGRGMWDGKEAPL